MFTCPFGTFANRRMHFGLYNAPAIFQRCMMGIFSRMVEKFMEVYINGRVLSLWGLFDLCLHNLSLVLERYQEVN